MKRILIVDDMDENLYLLRALLEGHGYEVEEARNGNEALSRAKAHMPDMIISDILMPEMDGFTFCSIIRKNETLKQVPFIFYTATYIDARDEKLALAMGADAFIVKPTEPEDFIRQVEEILKANKNGKLISPQRHKVEDEVILKEYNEVLIRKLEHKMLELEKTNKELESEIESRKQAEEALRDSEERFRLLFENSLDGVLLTEPNGKVLKANPSACLIFGRSEEEICELGRSGLVDTADPRLSKGIEERTRTGKVSGEITCLRKDGSAFPCDISSMVFKDSKGSARTSIILRDITDRKRAEEELRLKLSELQRWYTAMLDREDRVLEMKKEVNNLLEKAGRPAKYGRT